MKVRELQRTLWATAKQSEGRRFHALYDRVYRGVVLWEAWERVRKNKGAAGVDRVTLVVVEGYGVDRMLRELRHDLREGVYRPAPARRVEIPKPRGGKRPLGIPTVRDRVAQAAAKIVLEPIFEADFMSCSLGLRPKRSATMAKERLRRGFIEGYQFVVEFGIANFFGEIDHDHLLERVSRRRVVRYYLHRWPSRMAMARLGAKVRDRTGRNRIGTDIREVIAELNPILRGWGNYFRTGNAAAKFRQIDWYVTIRLFRLMVKKRGRNLRAGQGDQWSEEWFNGHGLHRLRGTIRYPKAA